MSKKYETPAEVRPLEELLCGFAYRNGLDVGAVFDDMLVFFIHGLSPEAPPLERWPYTAEQNKVFYRMYVEWIEAMSRAVVRRAWFDALGELYTACVLSPGRASSKGQFFTPAPLCDLMSAMAPPPADRPQGSSVGDPACGSGRTLLAWNAKYPGHYLVGEDIDRTCCMMTACNFLIHGCVGEVIWHDSLRPDSFMGGWRINEQLYPHARLGIRAIELSERVV